MKKRTIFWIAAAWVAALTAGHAQMISALPALAAPGDDDIMITEDDPGGSPVTSKTTIAQLKAVFQAGLEGDLSDSAGLAAAIDDETGSGLVVFNDSPTLVTPVLGAATATDLTLSGQSLYMNSGQTVSIKAGTGSPEGAVTAYIGSLWLATDGTTDTTLWRKEAGTGNTGWVAVVAAGGGDALVANPLSQFAATTSAQLIGVLSDESGSGVILTSTGAFSGTDSGSSKLFSAASMGDLEIDVTEMKNTLTITDVATVTFSATPSTGQIFGLTVKNTDTTDNALTIPSSYSENYNGARTTVTIPASGQVTLTWWYDGSQYNLYGDPVFPGDLTSDTTPTDSSVDIMTYTDVATGAMKSIPIDDLLALGGGGGLTTDSVGTAELDDDANTPVAGYAVVVETGAVSFDYVDLSGVYQGRDSDLTTWAGVTPGTGVATFLATPSSANLISAVTNETGSGALVFGTSPAFTTSITTASTSFTALAGATTLLTLGGTGASASTFFPSTLDTTSSTTGAIRTSGGISAAKAGNIGTTLTVGTGVDVGNADTSLTRSAAGVLAVEGKAVAFAPIFTESLGSSESVSISLATGEGYGSVHYITGNATITLPAVTGGAGCSYTFIAIGAVTITIDPNASDLLVRDGTAQTDGVTIVSTGTSGDIVVVTYYGTTGWHCATNGWSIGS